MYMYTYCTDYPSPFISINCRHLCIINGIPEPEVSGCLNNGTDTCREYTVVIYNVCCTRVQCNLRLFESLHPGVGLGGIISLEVIYPENRIIKQLIKVMWSSVVKCTKHSKLALGII